MLRLYCAGLLATASLLAQEKRDTAPLDTRELDLIWKERFIQNDDVGARQALRDVERLVRAPQLSVPFLKAKLKPAPTADSKQIATRIAELDSPSFEIRENAMKQLEATGTAAAPALEKALKAPVPLEVRQRLETLLERIDRQALSVDDLRGIRGIEVLEGIGSADAKALLETMAKGGEGAVLTDRARQALANLARRGN